MISAGQNGVQKVEGRFQAVPIFISEAKNDHTADFEKIRQNILAQAEDLFSRAYLRYTDQRGNFINAVAKLLSDESLKTAIFPKSPLRETDVDTLGPRIKRAQMREEELKDFGVIGSYTLVKSEEDNRGGNDPYDVYLHASLTVLPGTLSFVLKVLDHPETFRETRPYVTESKLCSLPSDAPAYYLMVGAFGVGGAMVLANENEGNSLYFHLHPSCTDPDGNTFTPSNVSYMDGLKLYQPLLIDRDGVLEEKALSVSTTVTIWTGLAGWIMSSFASEKIQRTTFAAGGAANEILAVLKRKPVGPVAQVVKP